MCQSLSFNKVAGLKHATSFKKRLWHSCFPVNFVKFLKTSFYIEHLWFLLLMFRWVTCILRGMFFKTTSRKLLLIFNREPVIYTPSLLLKFPPKTSEGIRARSLCCWFFQNTNQLIFVFFIFPLWLKVDTRVTWPNNF